MKECIKCHEVKPLDEFYTHPAMADGHLGKCKECCRADSRRNREENPQRHLAYDRARGKTESRKRKMYLYHRKHCAQHQEKQKARNAVNNAVRDGRLKKLPCEVCSNPRSTGHHDDYSKPLQIRWLCRRHHAQAHGCKHFSEDPAP